MDTNNNITELNSHIRAIREFCGDHTCEENCPLWMKEENNCSLDIEAPNAWQPIECKTRHQQHKKFWYTIAEHYKQQKEPTRLTKVKTHILQENKIDPKSVKNQCYACEEAREHYGTCLGCPIQWIEGIPNGKCTDLRSPYFVLDQLTEYLTNKDVDYNIVRDVLYEQAIKIAELPWKEK